MKVDAVKHGAGNFALIIHDAFRRFAAGQRRIIHMAATAGVHGGNQLELGGKGHMVIGAGNQRARSLDHENERLRDAEEPSLRSSVPRRYERAAANGHHRSFDPRRL